MNNPVNHRAIYFICCAIVVVILFVGVIGVTGLSPLDDHLFISTLFKGKDFGYYIMPELGRFFPLTAQEYALVSKFISPTPTFLYTINALKLLACGGLLAYCLSLSRLSNVGCGIIWGLVMLSSGIANTLFRLSAGELNAFLLLLIFIWSNLIKFDIKSDHCFNGRVARVLGIVPFVMAMFYKELIFVLGLAFSVYEWLRYYRSKHVNPPVNIYIVLIVSISYIAAYGVWRFFYTTGSYANFNAIKFWDVLGLFAINDPFIIVFVLPLTAYRAILICRRAIHHSVYDSCLMAASAYTSAFLALKIYNTYYLLPAYGFAACGIAGVLTQLSSKIIRKLVLMGSFVCLMNTATVSLSDIYAQKNTINNHYKFVNFLSVWLQQDFNITAKRRSLVLVGVSSGNSIEIINSLNIFLTSLGVPETLIDVKATEPTSNSAISLYYGVKNLNGYEPKIGDLLIYNPYQEVVTLPPLLSPSYQEIYSSGSEWSPPRWLGWHWVRLCLSNHTRCKSKVWQDRRFTGYVAVVLTRNPAVPNLAPLKSPSYRLGSLVLPARMRVGEARRLDILIENTGMEIWPATGALRSGQFVNLAYRWFNEKGEVALEGDRAPLPESMLPNDKAKISLNIKCPSSPGSYRLVIGPVQEGVRWFPYGIDEVNSIEIY